MRCVKGIVARLHGMTFAEFCTSSSGQKIMDAGDETSSQACDNTGKKLVADFVSRFHATCLKIQDLSEAEKLDRFVRALVPDIRLQVELRGPQNFHKAAMFAERVDAVINASLAKTRGSHGRKATRGVRRNDTIRRSKAVEEKPVRRVLVVLNRWNSVWRDARRCPVTNTKSYAWKMRVFIVASQTQGTSHVTAL